MIGIYCIRNQINGKCYVGQSVNIKSRIAQHFNLRDNHTICLHNAIRKYGKEMFVWEVLELCSEAILDDRECYWIDALSCIRPKGYNLRTGGARGRHTKEACDKIRIANIGKTLSAETREKLSKASKGRVPWNKGMSGFVKSRATLLKMSEAMKGEKNPRYGKTLSKTDKERLLKARRKKGCSAETRKKLSMAAKGRVRTPEMRERYRQAALKREAQKRIERQNSNQLKENE